MASLFAIRHAAHQIKHGGVIVYPTDTVYGLGCDPMDPDAISYINALKQRNASKGLILIADHLELFDEYITQLTQEEKEKITQTTTPTSWIVPAKKTTPRWLTGNHNSLAIRITQHPVIQKLCNQLQHPLVSTSANPGGKQPAVTALQAHQYFHDKVHAILVDDYKHINKPSVLKTLNDDFIFRH